MVSPASSGISHDRCAQVGFVGPTQRDPKHTYVCRVGPGLSQFEGSHVFMKTWDTTNTGTTNQNWAYQFSTDQFDSTGAITCITTAASATPGLISRVLRFSTTTIPSISRSASLLLTRASTSRVPVIANAMIRGARHRFGMLTLGMFATGLVVGLAVWGGYGQPAPQSEAPHGGALSPHGGALSFLVRTPPIGTNPWAGADTQTSLSGAAADVNFQIQVPQGAMLQPSTVTTAWAETAPLGSEGTDQVALFYGSSDTLVYERPTVAGVDTEAGLASSYQAVVAASNGTASLVTVAGEPALVTQGGSSGGGTIDLSLMVNHVYIDMVSKTLTGSQLEAAATTLGPFVASAG